MHRNGGQKALRSAQKAHTQTGDRAQKVPLRAQKAQGYEPGTGAEGA
ncbi:hypothetical protein SAMN05428979_2514 [Stappia sp. ES.058]|nr:hypothetical protein SAMN05428979_2514 [Stappia sp. ES.058]